jgi:diguanylate cyclase (GGDEF)-like protein
MGYEMPHMGYGAASGVSQRKGLGGILERRVAGPIRREIAQHGERSHSDNGQTAPTIACSLGVAVYPGDGTDEVTLSKRADEAMYRAKESGRGSVQRAA